MKKLLIVLLVTGICLGIAGMVMAGSSATQAITYEVLAINELSVSGSPGALVVSTAAAGSPPDDAINASTLYSITTNCGTDAKKITAAIDTAMPDNVSLNITLAAPTGATSVNEVQLGTSPADVVTNIDAVAESQKTIIYRLSATAAAGVVPNSVKVITLTITNS